MKNLKSVRLVSKTRNVGPKMNDNESASALERGRFYPRFNVHRSENSPDVLSGPSRARVRPAGVGDLPVLGVRRRLKITWARTLFDSKLSE